MKATIQSLRQSGHKVRVTHRAFNGEDRERTNVSLLAIDDHPSVTQIDVTTPKGEDATGYAFRSKNDNYDRKLGNKIALGRALAKLA